MKTMSKRMTLDECKSGRDFRQYVEHHPNLTSERQSGSHLCVKGTQPGTAVIPVHDGDMPNGTRRSVIKMLLLIGLGIFIMVCFIIPAISMAYSG